MMAIKVKLYLDLRNVMFRLIVGKVAKEKKTKALIEKVGSINVMLLLEILCCIDWLITDVAKEKKRGALST